MAWLSRRWSVSLPLRAGSGRAGTELEFPLERNFRLRVDEGPRGSPPTSLVRTPHVGAG